MFEIQFAHNLATTDKNLILPLFSEDSPPSLYEFLERETQGSLSRAAGVEGFKAAAGEVCLILAPAEAYERIVLAGLGDKNSFTTLAANEAGGKLFSKLAEFSEATLCLEGLEPALAAHIVLGMALKSYRFDRYQKKNDKKRLQTLVVASSSHEAIQKEWELLHAELQGVNLTRDLVSEPGNILTPVEFSRRIEALASCGLSVEVMDTDALRSLGFGALLGVAQGSENEPRVAIMRWEGADRSAPPVVFVGKGVTFDSGGISIKPAGGMEEMKWDMGGAGTVTGLMATLAHRRARVNAVGIVGLVENMPSGSAQRPGDVVRGYSGQTIEVLNTDAEGRLVLADILWYAQEQFQPRFMVDLATLTGAIVVSLGHEYAGLFSNDDTLSEQLALCGEAVGERVWRMPLAKAYDEMLKSPIADMKNIGGRDGGAITAAQFLQRFVNGVPWAHIDIAGTAWSSKDRVVTPAGATAFGVRLLNRLVKDHYEV